VGRALRKFEGKEKAEIFDFLIVGQKHLEAHSVERIMSFKKEPAFKISIIRSETLRY
jgi:superfamily II DNA or RNA helicase